MGIASVRLGYKKNGEQKIAGEIILKQVQWNSTIRTLTTLYRLLFLHVPCHPYQTINTETVNAGKAMHNYDVLFRNCKRVKW